MSFGWLTVVTMQTSEPTDELRDILHEDETFRWVVRPHLTARLVSKLTSGLVGAAVLAGFLGLTTYAIVREVPIAVGVSAVILVQHIVRAILEYYLDKIEYAATDQRLLIYRGRFGRSLTSVPFDGIQDSEYSIGAIENFFGVGTVTVDTDLGYERMTFPKTRDPEDFTREIAALT